jgi:hypothetical protein
VTTDNTVHLTAEDVAAFIDRRMTAAELPVVQAHLANCRSCREEVASVRRLLVRRPIARPGILIPIGVAAAAVIAFVALDLGRARTGVEADRVRTPAPATLPDDASPRIVALSPAEGDTVRVGRPVLLWSSVAGEPTYRLTMTDASGQPVWSSTTSDTTVTLPANVSLQPRRTYYWYVDALRADGRAVSTGVRRFNTP